MNGRVEAARLWWFSRTARERLLLTVMAAALAAVIGWYGVMAPLAAASKAGQVRLERAALRLTSLRALAPASIRSGPSSAATPQALVEAAAGKVGLPIARHRQDANGRFTIWITAIDAKILLPWVAILEREGGLTVTDFTASRLDSGVVEAEITFARVAR